MAIDSQSRTRPSSGNRVVVWVDDMGRKYNSIIPANAGDSAAAMGVKYGPPDLDALGLTKDASVRLHNELFDRGLFTYEQVKRSLGEVLGALQQALRVDAQTITTLYYRKEHPDG
jgi:hypothetical protein